ncbi:hypothetical protein phiAS5_ORF0194 [Aeromonas phage phiAS5]|uniref:Uncharacterized protein n=1 Tax=Aeromonas phage phiAS5 TaxID=879630 RepID=E1A2U1_9CAUD|nr:hypothetical protein phiAS5_ORF0194 [Aeromonas phage phiAS5]ADM80037.1 hypothetical protein phiAS5_ORF0194 [Aeromonas phage phiAS5]BES53193.1 hypothetical protein [Aeromonas phage phiWae14]
MKKMNAKNIKAGKTVYYVHALGENSFVTKYIVRNRPQVHIWKHIPKPLDESISLFVPAGYVFSDGKIGKHNSEFSLTDCNVGVKNSYNKHRLFFKKKAAERYCELCKQCGIDIAKREHNFESLNWDYPLEMDDYYEDEMVLDDDR